MLRFLLDLIRDQPLIGSKSFRTRLLSNELLSPGLLQFLLILAILVNIFGILFPVLGSNDSYFYGVVAKHIIENHDWINLSYAGHDWLDKPHFPFWLTAISYKIFGINAVAYILPGFIFYLIGARYTYLLARHLYTPEVGVVASILYLTAIHLMLSAIDVRAEAYLLGEIIPACYYWHIYNQDSSKKLVMLKGAIFTALAIMTKGVFVVLTVFGGVVSLWLYNRQWKNFTNSRFLLALAMSLLFITPELLALVLQFDLHPEKVVFGKTGVSGLRFFFWDSQFGRFFDNGPITSGHISNGIGHYFYFIHTFLWAYLPWSMVFFVALYNIYKDFRLSPDLPKVNEQKNNHIFLLGSFIPTFLLFSCTTFQLDHYTNILIPFATIISANWICNKATRFVTHPVFYIQVILSYILWLAVSIMAILVFNGTLFVLMISICVLTIALFGIFNNNRQLNKSMVYPVLAILLVFSCLMLIGGRLYLRYDAGYKISEYLVNQPKLTLVDYHVDYSSLEFHNKNPYLRVESLSDLGVMNESYYLVIHKETWNDIQKSINTGKIIGTFPWIRQEKYIPTLFSLDKRNKDTEELELVLVPEASVNKKNIKRIDE
jgi:4-amino-4-deoxy-L-arabinose transferase-like glycosyltransferase